MPGRWCTQSPASTSVSLSPYMNLAQPLVMMHDLELRLMAVPAGALFGCHVGLDEVRDARARAVASADAEVLVEEEVAQAVAAPAGVGGLDVRELGGRLVQHEALLRRRVGMPDWHAQPVPIRATAPCPALTAPGQSQLRAIGPEGADRRGAEDADDLHRHRADVEQLVPDAARQHDQSCRRRSGAPGRRCATRPSRPGRARPRRNRGGAAACRRPAPGSGATARAVAAPRPGRPRWRGRCPGSRRRAVRFGCERTFGSPRTKRWRVDGSVPAAPRARPVFRARSNQRRGADGLRLKKFLPQ